MKIKAFLGISQNAVIDQVLVALCLYLLLAYLKFQSRVSKSLQQILRLLQTNLFIRRPLLELLKPLQPQPPPQPQLRLGLVRKISGTAVGQTTFSRFVVLNRGLSPIVPFNYSYAHGTLSTAAVADIVRDAAWSWGESGFTGRLYPRWFIGKTSVTDKTNEGR